jgi:hypothetical protein
MTFFLQVSDRPEEQQHGSYTAEDKSSLAPSALPSKRTTFLSIRMMEECAQRLSDRRTVDLLRCV